MFKEWPKIRRYKENEVCITEKMDGTNACIIIEDGEIVGCQSRTKIITPKDDNYGFAGWVERNKEELVKLGDGYHYGEWVGNGIQKNPHKLDRKYFYLFNSGRWDAENKPACCEVVPVLYQGPLLPNTVNNVMDRLKSSYSLFDDAVPEGIIIYYIETGTYAKATFAAPEGKWKLNN